jgi:putative transposase
MQNALVESFNGLNETLFVSLPQARVALEVWRRDYNNVRSHSRVGWLAPPIYAAQFGPQWAKALCSANGSALHGGRPSVPRPVHLSVNEARSLPLFIAQPK